MEYASDNFLNKMRVQGDELADDVASILWSNRDRPIMEDLKVLSENHHKPLSSNINNLHLEVPLSKTEIDTFQNYYDFTGGYEKHITEADMADFKLNAEIFKKYGYLVTSILFFKSLPTGYMCPKPGEVLHSTKLLEKFAARRVMETAQFVFAVNKADWYKPESQGLEAIEKVRMMHAGMRTALLKKKTDGKGWDMNLGVPINQEDIALTNYLFCLAIIEGLDEVGIHLFDNERKAVYNTWMHIGRVMGIRPELLPKNYKDGWLQYRKILKRQKSKTNAAGPHLTNALLQAMNQMTYNEIGMENLEDICLYFVNDSYANKSLGLRQQSILDRVFYGLVHFILGLKIWQVLFHHKREGFFSRLINKAGNWFVIKKFNLGPYLKKHPGANPLESFSKVMMNSLTQRDLRNFENMNAEERKKSFVIDDELYLEWGLGGFDMHVDV